jgi:capsid protein
MTRRAALFQKMALKQKLYLTKQLHALSIVRDELSKNRAMKAQLEELLEADKATVHSHSGMSLYSASWFNTQVRDQLLSISNKCEHLAKEVVTLKKDIASAEHKRSRQEDKATELVAEARKLTQDQADIQLTELRRR